jgi:thiol-disulfide isomerase/thioredoxin
MSTPRSRPRLLSSQLRTLGRGLGLVACLCLAGCSSTTPGLRSAGSSNLKTSLAVGDKPLPVVGGEPGSSVATEDDEPTITAPSKRTEGRISGRVYDVDGRPVPNAHVRLAVSASAGGKVLRATTDPSGGFTLHGLRPGTSYTLIAESSGAEGFQTGRARAMASQTDVRISLATPGTAGEEGQAAEGPRGKVNRVSDRDGSDGSDDPAGAGEPAPARAGASGRAREPERGSEPAAGDSRVNEEDIPPVPEVEALGPGRSSPRGTSSETGRQRGQESLAADDDRTAAAPSRRLRSATEPTPIDPVTRGTAAPRGGELPDDEGPNPLPPALEPGQAPYSPTSSTTSPQPAHAPVEADPFADVNPRLASKGRSPSTNRSPSSGLVSAYDSPSRSTEPQRPRPLDEPTPGALVVTPETFAPVVLNDDPFKEAPVRTASAAAPKPAARPVRAQPRPAPVTTLTPPARPAPAPLPAATEAAAGDLPPAVEASPTKAPKAAAVVAMATPVTAPARRQPTWGEVAAGATPLPPLEGEADAKVKASAVARRDPPVRGVSATTTTAETSAVAPRCEYDDRHRRLIEFRLPDLEGKPVRFSDLDADLVLLDFWGTWCQPCVRSVPHLVDLQARTAGKRLKVVGIACETDAPEVAARNVAASVAKLKINYPVLLSRNDGTCPLQEALHVQALPTMVLLDRQGRVLWRDQGATTATLARLDHMIASATGDAAVKR